MEEQISSAFIRACLCDYCQKAWLTDLSTGLFCHRGHINFFFMNLIISYLRSEEVRKTYQDVVGESTNTVVFYPFC